MRVNFHFTFAKSENKQRSDSYLDRRVEDQLLREGASLHIARGPSEMLREVASAYIVPPQLQQHSRLELAVVWLRGFHRTLLYEGMCAFAVPTK
jgi:hypothetical protein